MSAAADSQAAQTGLLIAVANALRNAWPRITWTDPTLAAQQLNVLVAALLHRYGPASATLAIRYYNSERAAAGIGEPFRVRPADLPPDGQVAATVGWATEPLRTDSPSEDAVESRLVGAVERLVMNVGRETLATAVQDDKHAHGWARVTRPGACSFCRLVATRGAIYKTQATAGRSANSRFGGEGEFKWHNNCHCYIEPLFADVYEPTAQARSDLALYAQVTRGLSGAAARAAFRQAIEAS